MELKSMRSYSASLGRPIDVQKEIITDSLSHWSEAQIMSALNTFERITEAEEPLESIVELKKDQLKAMAHLSSLALQEIVKCILDKNIFLEEEESQ